MDELMAWTAMASGKKKQDTLLKKIMVDVIAGDGDKEYAKGKDSRDLVRDDEFLIRSKVFEGEATDPSDDKAAAAAAVVREREMNEMMDDILGCKTVTDFYTVYMKHSSSGDAAVKLLRREIVPPFKTCKFDHGPVGVGEAWGPCVARAAERRRAAPRAVLRPSRRRGAKRQSTTPIPTVITTCIHSFS